MTTSEVEALGERIERLVYETEGAPKERWASIGELALSIVRAQDAARGSETDPDVLDACFRGVDSELPDIGRMLRGAFSAQGRAIAALTLERDEARYESQEETEHKRLALRERDEARAELAAKDAVALQWETDARRAESTIAAKDARIAELKAALADARQDASSNEHEVDSVLSSLRAAEARIAELEGDVKKERGLYNKQYDRANRAESALATLRQATLRWVACGVGRLAWDGVAKRYARPDAPPCGCVGCELADALYATPAPEHPDTAKVRAVRERARIMREDRSMWREAAKKEG